MQNSGIKLILFSFIFMFSIPQASLAVDEHEAGEEKDEPIGDLILHHITDSHYWEFWHGGTIYLPVILYSEAEGFKFYPSSRPFFDDHLHPVPFQGYLVDHGKIQHEDGEAAVYDFSITKNVAQIFLSIILLLFVFITVAKHYQNPKRAPKGIQAFFEPIIVFIKDEVAIPNIGLQKYKRFMPYLLTLFFFIWFNNVLGLMPGAANVTGNIAVTGVLAILTFIITQFSGNKHYWQHIFNTPGVPWWLKWGIPIMPVVEFIGLFTKPFALMVRLFANITAGHIIILSLFSLIFIFESILISPVSVAFSIFMFFLELFVAILQAYIFTLLSAMYFGGAVEETHHHDEEGQIDQALI
ncbi:MAG: F0F1 ATP synthase subunit A [Cyclobacteriaceae bacterium]